MNRKCFYAMGLLALLITACATQQYGDYRRVANVGDELYKFNSKSDSFTEHANRVGRGHPSEYDPGPETGSRWAELFASAPNYRALGKAIIGGTDEKFRWMFGPMWYRGRLGENQVKAFVVGQEGAQDENITNRAFTGSTGTKTQKFLNHLGLYRSYLFLNTFVYTINGQLEPENPKFAWMEQGETSPIVEYRHSLFDQMLMTNNDSLSLILGVGSGGKASVATWVNARGGTCSPSQDLKNCDVSGMVKWFSTNKGITIRNKILVIGVPHPGGANPNLGGDAALQNIIRGFTGAAQRVAEFKRKNPSWLDLDPDEKATTAEYLTRLDSEYKYGNAPVPFRDFSFGTAWRMGSDGTSSNRWGSDAIQFFSSKGEYGDKSAKYGFTSDSKNFVSYHSENGQLVTACPDISGGNGEDVESSKTADGSARCNGVGGMMEDDLNQRPPQYDLAYEHPRLGSSSSTKYNHFDFGPCGWRDNGEKGFSKNSCTLGKLLTSWPDFNTLPVKPISHASLGFGPSYRGRLDRAAILVLADQESHDDMFSTRALTGEGGQRLQSFLNSVGVGYGKDGSAKGNMPYAILRTLPVDTLGMPQKNVEAIALNKSVVDARNAIVQEILGSGTRVVVSYGAVAEKAVKAMNIKDAEVFNLPVPAAGDTAHIKEWNKIVKSVSGILKTKSENYDGTIALIPREDLPYSTRWWMGTSGTRALRGEGQNITGHYYRVFSPRWVKGLKSKPLSKEGKNSETEVLKQKMKDEGLL